MSKPNVSSLMSVLKATVQTETGVEYPGAYMPSGNPVTAAGVALADLMKDGSMVQQWHDAVRSQYEREKDEANNASGSRDPAPVDSGGKAAPAREHDRVAAAAPVYSTDPKAALQEAADAGRDRLAELSGLIADLECEHRELHNKVAKIERALRAFEED